MLRTSQITIGRAVGAASKVAFDGLSWSLAHQLNGRLDYFKA
jgi:hypothetical protein